ncbi:TFIIB-type zinc ribbon-containing protein [Candidatus Saccharibacteria bacterium]|nr:TFIIB-type zinc ribbon-containing protein [Candidatus Saccharibacteria bacterium]
MAIDNNKNGMNRCPHCGSTDTTLDTSTGNLKCNFCRSQFKGNKINAHGGVENLKGDIIGAGAGDIIPDEKVILTLKCPACGAEVVINTDEVTSARCHWCRHVLSVNEKMPNGAVPDLVLPFKTEKKFAEEKIDEFVHKRKFFAHPTFTKEFSSENVMGVYLPYMIVDVNAHAALSGEAEHLVKRYTVGSGNSQKTYYDADAYNVSREFDLLIDDLTIESSSDKLKQDLKVNTNNVINSIMPFDTDNCVAWNPSYLRGYASEKRDTDVNVLKPAVEVQSKDIARYQARQTMEFYDRGARWESETLEIKGTSWKAAYLPVWLYSYYQQDKQLMHYVAVNARTGETMGSVPINKTRLMIVSTIVEVLGIILGWFWFRFWIGVDMDDDNPAFWGVLGFTPGFIFYWWQVNRYRNMSARHMHEKDTKSSAKDMKKTDSFKEHRKRLRQSRILGENGNSVYGVLAKNGEKMMGEKMANYLGIGRMFGSTPDQTPTGQQTIADAREKGKKTNAIVTVILVIAILFILLVILS